VVGRFSLLPPSCGRGSAALFPPLPNSNLTSPPFISPLYFLSFSLLFLFISINTSLEMDHSSVLGSCALWRLFRTALLLSLPEKTLHLFSFGTPLAAMDGPPFSLRDRIQVHASSLFYFKVKSSFSFIVSRFVSFTIHAHSPLCFPDSQNLSLYSGRFSPPRAPLFELK